MTPRKPGPKPNLNSKGKVIWKGFAEDDQPDPVSRDLDIRIPIQREMNLDELSDRDAIEVSQVMPTGKTKADMCLRCFQIPSSNGVCGC